jgi:CubicO group peptidase (beta-lactamase class C family)
MNRRGTLRRAWLVLAALALLPAPAAAQTRSGVLPVPTAAQEGRFAADFDAFIAASMRRLPMIPALSVAVSRSRGPIFVRAYGEADRERHLQATPHTRFYIASSTKSFVALAFARLAAERRIDLGWTLAELAPDITFPPEVRAREVTLRHLLSHSHGLIVPGIEFRLAYTGEHDRATLWRLLRGARPNPRAPLGSFNYGNLGYNVAAMLIERRLGRRWQDLLNEQVLRPLRLDETFAQGLQRSRAPRAAPYASLAPGGPERLRYAKSDAILQSAGGMYSSAGDMGRWVALQLAAERNQAGLAIPASLVAGTHRPIARMDLRFGPFARTGYGLGWYSGDYRGETLYHSFGSFSGARAHTSFLPARDIGVAITTNDEGAGFFFVDVAAAFAYDWFLLGPEAAARNGEEALARLEAEAARQAEAFRADRARRAARPWRLSLPVAAYRGRYCNDERGTMTLAGRGATLEVRMGLLRADAEPYTDVDTARVALIPNTGQVFQFTRDGGRITAVRTEGSEFRRC